MSQSTETITWIDADSQKPDDDIIVLVASPTPSEPVWPGYYDSESNQWMIPDGFPFSNRVTYWAEMPSGPQS